MHQQQVAWLAVGEELFHGQVDHVRGLVQQRAHAESADGRIAQHGRQRPGVAGRGPQPPQPQIGVLIAGDDQRAAYSVHGLSPARVPGQPLVGQPPLLLR